MDVAELRFVNRCCFM